MNVKSWQQARLRIGGVKIAIKVELNASYCSTGMLEAGDYDFYVDDYFLEIEKNPFNLLKVELRFYLGTDVFYLRAAFSEDKQSYKLDKQSLRDINNALRAYFNNYELQHNSELAKSIDNDAMQAIDKMCGAFAFAHAKQYLETYAAGGLKDKYLEFKGVA